MSEAVENTDLQVPMARYSLLAQAFHWVSAALMFAVVPIAWYMTTLERTDPTREDWYSLHKSIGITILVLSVARVIWRQLDAPPSLSGFMRPVEAAAVHVAHGLLYVLLFAMPISGYLISAAGGRSRRRRTFRPKAMFSSTVMCRNSA